MHLFSRFFGSIVVLLVGAGLSACDSIKPDQVTVKQYTGSEITRQSVLDGWRATVAGDRVTLQFHNQSDVGRNAFGPGDRFYVTLKNRSSGLPVFVEGFYIDGNGSQQVFSSGTIEIAEWDVDGIVSGVIEGNPYVLNTSTAFWVDMAAQAE